MPRPTKYDELDESTLRGEEVFTIHTNNVPPTGPLYKAIGAFLDTAQAAKLIVTQNYGRMVAYRPPTDTELNEALERAQREWDSSREKYEASLISGTMPEDYTRYAIEKYCRTENLPFPWEA